MVRIRSESEDVGKHITNVDALSALIRAKGFLYISNYL